MATANVNFDVTGGVAHIKLNRPEAYNAINLELTRDLLDAVHSADDDPAVRAVVLSGEGKTFCVGGDLKSFTAKGEELSRYIKEVTTYLHAAVSRMTRMSAPVVAAVHGSAAGAGMSLACACDYVVAADSARFTMAYTAIGLVPDGSSTYFLPRIVGLRRALELALTNRVLTAEEAQAWGIVTEVVSEDELLDAAHKVAARFAAGPTEALGTAKRLLHSGWNETLETQMEHETQAIAGIARSADAQEGIKAFLEKRKPEFGR